MKDIKVKNKSIKITNKSSILYNKAKSSVESLNRKTDKFDSQNYSEEDSINPTKKLIKSTFNTNFKLIKKTTLPITKKLKEKQKLRMMRKAAKNNAKRARQAAKETRKTFYITYKVVKKIVPLFINLIFKVIALLLSFGIYAILIIVAIMIAAVILGSYQGILFTSEDISDTKMKDVIKSLNSEMANRINEIKSNNEYDEYKIISNKADWKEVLAIYSVKVSNNNQNEVITLDENKINELKGIFWTANSIRYEILEENLSEEYDAELIENKNVLYVYIDSKPAGELMNIYHFNENQRKQMEDLLSGYYDDLWLSVIYGTPIENSNDVVTIALSQVGQVGGEPYWRWYGFDSRVEWCAIFVSWVMNQAGVDESIMPKFAVVSTGANWFKAIGSWHGKEYKPKPGDIIFFDWENDGRINHVGIVEYSDDEYVYTIEGNSNGDTCRQKQYSLSNNVIYGYGSLYQ